MQGYSNRDVLLTLIGGHFMDKAVSAVKQKKTLRGTGDNWDLTVRAHHIRSSAQNKDLHLFASNLYINRTSFITFDNKSPLDDILTCPRNTFTLNQNDIKMLRENFMVLIGRICTKFCKSFQFFSDVLPDHITHRFSKEMAHQSIVIPLPILNADEKKYDDCVCILRAYENWIYEVYEQANLLNHIEDAQLPSNSAQQNESGADPLADVAVLFGGDQLTRVRFAGAKDLLAGAHTPADRFEHCSPFKPAMWHTKASLLQYSYHLLYSAQSSSEKGTLKYFREKYNRKNATPSKVLDSYEGSEELFISAGKAYIVTALIHFFGMKSVEDIPTKNMFPRNISNADASNKMSYFEKVIGDFVDQYVFQGLTNSESDDFIKNYALCFIYLTLTVLQMKDTAAEGDGDRNLLNQKLLLTVFKSLGSYSKYAIEMFNSVAQMEVMLTARRAEEFKWGFFTNWNGGEGRNIEDDLVQEICNRLSKEVVQRMGANKTIYSISKACKAIGGIKMIVEQFYRSAHIHKVSGKHAVRSSTDDEYDMIKELQLLNPFQHVQGRKHNSFLHVKRSPLLYLNIVEFHKWIEKHRKKLATRQ